MTACVIIAGLVPILWSHGAGADVMKRIATPMVGGVVTSTVMELVVYPAIFLPLALPRAQATRTAVTACVIGSSCLRSAMLQFVRRRRGNPQGRRKT